MEQRRAEIERQQEEIRQRIEREMDRRADDVQLRQEDVARHVERALRRGHRGDGDARVVMGTPVHVKKGESTGDVVAIGGGITVDGEVIGDAVSVGGSERITGLVTGSVVSVGGSVHLGPEARVMQDVVSVGGSVEREPGAEILGKVTEVSLWQGLTGGSVGRWGGWNWQGAGWDVDTTHSYFDGALLRFVRCVVFVLVLILLGVLASVIARNPLERTSAAAVAEPWKAGVVGLLAVVLFVPAILIVLVLLAVSIIGIPRCAVAVRRARLRLRRLLRLHRVGARAGPLERTALRLAPGGTSDDGGARAFLFTALADARRVDVVDSSRDAAASALMLLCSGCW